MVRRLPSLNALRAFEAAARLESLTLAAGELNVAQAAVSRHVRDLEVWLGAKLFHRTGRGVTLTNDGATLAADLTDAFNRLASAVDRFDSPGRAQRLIVSSDVSFAALWLVPRLKSFIARHPDIELVVDPNSKLVDYAKGEADIGIRYGGGNWKGIAAERLFEALLSPVCHPKLRTIASPAHLLQAQLIREDAHDYWPDWFAAAGLVAAEPLRGPQVRGELAIAAAESGSGFALADDVQAGDALMSGRLVRPFELRIEKEAAYYVVHAEGARLSKAAQHFREWLRAECKEFKKALASWETGAAHTRPKPAPSPPRSTRKTPAASPRR